MQRLVGISGTTVAATPVLKFLRGMQAPIERLAQYLASGVTAAIIARGSSSPCPDCACSPALHCPALECRCPGGEGRVAPRPRGGRQSSWRRWWRWPSPTAS
eukprot:5025687-Pyramimonas_sp.AAC.1